MPNTCWPRGGRPGSAGRRARALVETLVGIAILCLLVVILVPAMCGVVERTWTARCRGHLGELYRAMNVYLHPDRGGNWMPASQPDGPHWFEKLEPLVAGYEEGEARERFVCPKAPHDQRGFTRQSLSFGWNERDFPFGSVISSAMTPREKLVLGDSLGTATADIGPWADTVVTQDGELRVDARHGQEGNLLFLDGHVEACSREAAAQRWASWTLAPARPPGQTASALAAIPWSRWLLVVALVALPYGLVVGGVRYVQALKAARTERLRRQQEEAERQERMKEEAAREAARKEYLRKVPSGPVEPVSLPRGVLRWGRLTFQVQPDRELTIGRAKSVGASIRTSRNVSREHAKIRPEPRGYVLYDLYSRTGTFVGGKRIESKVLADGDRIRIGSDVEMTFDLGASHSP